MSRMIGWTSVVQGNAVAQPLWQPSAERIQRARMQRFRRRVEAAHGGALPDRETLDPYRGRPELAG